VLDAKARELVQLLRPIRGVADLDYDHFVGQPQLQIVVDRTATARYGINVQDVQDAIEAATKGRTVTEVFEGERRFDLTVRLRTDGDLLSGLRRLAISAPNGERIPVVQLAEFIQAEGVAEINRDGNQRRVAVKWSVRERDMGSLVAEAMQTVKSLSLPHGYRMVWSGRFEDQQRALARLYVIVPLVIFIIFILLFGAFQSVGDALLIMLNLPFALIGGTLALWLWGANFNISAAVGYIAVFGVSVLNGVVLVSSIRQARTEEGLSIHDAVIRACEIRFRPIVVSAIVAVIGFLPAALSQGIGAEIQRPLARVVIGGLISSTALTLLVLPALYALRTHRGRVSDGPVTS